MRAGETERDYNGVNWEWSQDDRKRKRSYEGTQKDMRGELSFRQN